MVDLHIHSQYSDGTDTVEDIFEEARRKGIEHISITDHHKTDAYLLNDTELLQEKYGVKITVGVEIDCIACGEYAHILGYGFDTENETLRNLIDSIFDDGIQGDIDTLKMMQKKYKNISAQEFIDYRHERSNGGWRFINYVHEKGLTRNLLDGMKFYRQYPSNLKATKCTLETVCSAIHAAGGIAVYAHPPYSLGDDAENILVHMQKALDCGIDGIECYHPIISDKVSCALIGFCDKNNLYITGGGDCHGEFLDKSKYYIGGQCHDKIRFI